MKRLMFVLVGLGIFFQNPAHAGGLVGEGKITSMQQGFSGWVLKIEGMSNPDSCSVQTIYLGHTVPTYETQFSLLLTAFATGKPVNIKVDGCTASGYMVAQWVYALDW